jgi:NitT/TauT family transport system permease protein
MVSDAIVANIGFNDIIQLLTYSGYSLLRMFIALVLSYTFAIIYGVVAARNKKAEKILLPILDILQSVPILGFFPAAIFFFIALFHESWMGVELAAVFLIFTSQAWNLAFAVYESVSSIPNDLMEASGSLRLKGLRRVKILYLPPAIPKIVYNGILSWSTGWYYLVACEIITIGSKSYTINGIGSYLANATYAGNYQDTILGLGVLVCMIVLIDLALWRPLRSHANKFRYEATSSDDEATHKTTYDPRLIWLRNHLVFRPQVGQLGLSHAISVVGGFKPIAAGVRYATEIRHSEEPRFFHKYRNLIFTILGLAVVAVFMITDHNIITNLTSFPNNMSTDMKKPDVLSAILQIPAALGYSMLRLLIAYLISIAWILPLALKLASRPRSFGTSIFTMEVLASIPATAIFPIIILFTMKLPGGLELTSIILTMTGMQWYLLFNILGGVKAIPSDLTEAANTYHVKGFQKLK